MNFVLFRENPKSSNPHRILVLLLYLNVLNIRRKAICYKEGILLLPKAKWEQVEQCPLQAPAPAPGMSHPHCAVDVQAVQMPCISPPLGDWAARPGPDQGCDQWTRLLCDEPGPGDLVPSRTQGRHWTSCCLSASPVSRAIDH